MKQIYSVKIILKYNTDISIYEEDIILVEMDSVDELRDKCQEYVDAIQNDLNDYDFVELHEIVNWNLTNCSFSNDMNFKEVYSEFISIEDLGY